MFVMNKSQCSGNFVLLSCILFACLIFQFTPPQQERNAGSALITNTFSENTSKFSFRQFPARWTIFQCRKLDRKLAQYSYLGSTLQGKQRALSSLYQLPILNTNISQFEPFSMNSAVNIWDLFPPPLSCPDIERVGNVGDGGKWVCGLDHLSTLSPPSWSASPSCVIYSYGISTDISFELQLLRRTNCELHLFDPTIGELPFNNKFRNSSLSLSTAIQQSKSQKNDALQFRDVSSRVFFHKSALSTESGGSDERNLHMMNEHILDTMYRLNHSFISILKVDIEGAEWQVFADLFGRFSPNGQLRGPLVPIGQILIELHYETNDKVLEFFSGASTHGFHPFSREINLQPCIAGRKPVAVEYSLINARNYYGFKEVSKSSSNQEEETAWKVPSPVRAVSLYPVKGVIYFLTRRERIELMSKSLQLLFVNFLRYYPEYPVVIFHDDYSPADVASMTSTFSAIDLRFVQISLTLPKVPSQYVGKVPKRTRCAPSSSTLGYRHMCRFHAFLVSKYLADSGFAHFEYQWRLDDDSVISHPIGYDVFRFMKWNKKLYGFVNIVPDAEDCVRGLWDLAEDFLSKKNVSLNVNESSFHILKEPNVFYNNFEISHMSLWRNPLWLQFADYIDQSFGIYLHRWGDAPLRTIGVGMMISKSQLHSFSDIGYSHSPFVMQSPTGLPHPRNDPLVGRSLCIFYDRWMCNGSSAGNYSNISYYPSTFSTSLSRIDIRTDSQRFQQTESGVLFSFGHAGRETVLANSVSSLFKFFARKFNRPIIIFYSNGREKKGLFDSNLMTEMLPAEAMASVTFIPVVLTKGQRANYGPLCGSSDPDYLAASEFLRFQAFQELKSRGYQWFLRFSDDSQLLKEVSFDLFEQMRNEGRRYGFKFRMNSSSCSAALKSVGDSICSTAAFASERSIQCLTGNRLEQEGIILNAFEVSHVSVWESDICLAMFYSAGDKALIQERYNDRPALMKLLSVYFPINESSKSYSDSEWHNLCVDKTLTAAEVFKFDDIFFSFRWNSDSKVRNRVAERVESLPKFDAAFSPQRVGWLGGDVAASIPLPNPDDFESPPKKIIWLFADSWIGVSNGRKRIFEYSYAISNSVGVSTMRSDKIANSSIPSSPVRDIQSVKYFWNSDSAGEPSPIFARISGDCGADKSAFWPVSGVAVLPSTHRSKDDDRDGVRLLIVGDLICRTAKAMRKDQNALQFRHVSSVIVVVMNPYEDPTHWDYQFQIYPNERVAVSTIASSLKNSMFASRLEDVFLLASLTSDSSSQQVLLRVPTQDLLDLNIRRVLVLSNNSVTSAGIWSPISQSIPLPLFSPGVGEASLHFDRSLLRWIIVYTLAVMSTIQICSTATSDIESPWSCFELTDVDEKWNQIGNVFSYAGRAHPSLLNEYYLTNSAPLLLANESNNSIGPTQLLISFVPNAFYDFGNLFDEVYLDIYTPKFILVRTK